MANSRPVILLFCSIQEEAFHWSYLVSRMSEKYIIHIVHSKLDIEWCEETPDTPDIKVELLDDILTDRTRTLKEVYGIDDSDWKKYYYNPNIVDSLKELNIYDFLDIKDTIAEYHESVTARQNIFA